MYVTSVHICVTGLFDIFWNCLAWFDKYDKTDVMTLLYMLSHDDFPAD